MVCFMSGRSTGGSLWFANLSFSVSAFCLATRTAKAIEDSRHHPRVQFKDVVRQPVTTANAKYVSKAIPMRRYLTRELQSAVVP